MKIFKYSVIFLCIAFAISFVIIAAMIIKQNMVDIVINDNVNSLIRNVKYKNPVKTEGVPLTEQKISCGYACIEMLSEYFGDGSDTITENALYEANGEKITTSTNNGLYNEIKKQFPDYTVTQHKNLKNSELIDTVYDSLSDGMPVIFTYAAIDKQSENQNEKVWTVHCGIVVEMDLPGGKITVNNPYGHTETYSVSDFLKATRFESYENMEFYLKLGFSAEIFTKNTVYILEKTEDMKDT